MDMETYYRQFENCLQEEKPYCSDDCPFHMDVLDFQDKMGRKRYNAAYKIFRNAVAFPDLVAALCPKYCEQRCPMSEAGGAIQVNLLERTCVAKAKRKDPNQYNLPAKAGKVAVVGGGISGLACALRVASKKYEVVLYEKSDKLGGQLNELLPEDLIRTDIERQFKYETYSLNLNTEIKNIDELVRAGFDAVYVATGRDGLDFGVLHQQDGHCALHGKTAVFAGGSLAGKDLMHALADGIDMAWSIETYLKTGNVRYPEAAEPTKVVADLYERKVLAPIVPTDEGVFTDEEVEEELARCLRCQCDGCRTYCDLTAYFDKWPMKMRDEIMTTTMPADSMIHKTPAIKLINACTQCRLCDEVCPGNIELGAMIKEARKKLHKLDRMPGAYHQFWVRDMQFANGPYAALAKPGPGRDQCEYAFFPGCHLGAADPEYVEGAYGWMLSKEPGTGLLLRCCGVPADWAGNEELHQKEIDSLREDWESMGSPTLIMACPSCMRHFREYLPDVPIISLYEIMRDWGMEPAAQAAQETYSIFDPCSARNDDEIQDAVRALTAKAGIDFEELPKGAKHGCCGFGGNVEVANPKFAKHIAEERSGLSENPYITYCINCRDVFIDENKPVKHILDILLGIEPKDGRLPTVTERRCNRVFLKEHLLDKIWGETMAEKPELTYHLKINDDIRDKMNRLKVLEEDICHVLEMGEVHGRRTLDPEKGTYKCYREVGYITCWVEYRVQEEVYEIVNLYTHRMKIELEAVWNGRKTDTDLR